MGSASSGAGLPIWSACHEACANGPKVKIEKVASASSRASPSEPLSPVGARSNTAEQDVGPPAAVQESLQPQEGKSSDPIRQNKNARMEAAKRARAASMGDVSNVHSTAPPLQAPPETTPEPPAEVDLSKEPVGGGIMNKSRTSVKITGDEAAAMLRAGLKPSGIEAPKAAKGRRNSMIQASPEELADVISNNDEIFSVGSHSLCFFGITTTDKSGKAIIDPDWKEKCLEIAGQSSGFQDKLPAVLTKLGMALTCQKGRKPTQPNQDNCLLCHMDNITILGVADGHGPDGHWASHWAVRALVRLTVAEVVESDGIPDDNVVRRIFDLTHNTVMHCSEKLGFDLQFSGTTVTMIIIDRRDRSILSAWVGDSRSVLGRREKPGDNPSSTKPEVLCLDHKPQDREEKTRIQKCGGEVIRHPGDIPHRVFRKNDVAPGLAMSRSMGDLIAHEVGVIHTPGIKRCSVAAGAPQQLLLCCSDGVWEFLSNAHAVTLVAKYGPEKVHEANLELVRESREKWLEEDDSMTDDITAFSVWI